MKIAQKMTEWKTEKEPVNLKMKQKILITGGLGYLGRASCDLLKNNSDYQVTVVDSNFLPDKVKWLNQNNIKFVNSDIFNIQNELSAADFIIHFAGITQVPQTVEQSNSEIDTLIHKVGTFGTREIIKHANKNSKIFFASSHVVFEGINAGIKNVNENSNPCPILAYGKSKRQSEIDFLESDKNFTVFRLASVYGYNPNMRFRILPNLFSSLAAQNKNLKVFGSGENLKPLIGCEDVVRAIQFTLEKNLFDREIIHVSNENLTVLEIAKLCQKFKPEVQISHTNDAIINDGYSFYGDKLQAAGFNFENNISDEIEKMIQNWSFRGF